MPDNKPGYKTTEFWMALGSLLSAILVQFGLVPLSDQQHLAGSFATAATAIFLSLQYITGRNQIKTPTLPVERDPTLTTLLTLLGDLARNQTPPPADVRPAVPPQPPDET